MTDKLISVIIPVYKVEKYLEECVDSIISQTYENLEIILVDDGSPDKCPDLCDRYKETDGRIKVIHKENGGLSSARNAGIDICSGEYIAFIDSDDRIAEDYMEKLCSAIETENADIAMCDFMYTGLLAQYNKKYNSLRFPRFIADWREVLRRYYEDENGTALVVAWGKLYRRELFRTLRYPVGRIHEDEFVFAELMLNCRKAVWIEEKLYFYLQRENSIMSDKNNRDSFVARCDFYRQRCELYSSLGENELLKSEKKAFFLHNKNAVDYFAVCKKDDELYKALLNGYRENAGAVIKGAFSAKEKLKMLMLSTAPRLFCKIIRRLKK